jgi:hypothetical protein
MPPAQNPSPASSNASQPDALDALMSNLLSSPSVAAAPASSARTLSVATARQSATRPPSAPSSTTSASSTLGGVSRGLLTGETPLFYFENRTRDVLCAGYIGGKSGLKQRFCCKRIEGGVGNSKMFCSQAHMGEKFLLTPRAYYIPMKSSSALVSPFVAAAELERAGSLALAAERHSSQEWIEIITAFNSARGIRAPPYVFPDPEDADPQDDGVDDGDFHDASSGLITSVVRGACALRMLSTSRFETLKSLLPVVDLFGSSVKEEASDEEAVQEEGAIVPRASTSLDTLVKLIPDGFTELEDRLRQAVKLLEDEMARMSVDHTTLWDQVFGSVDFSAFIEEFESLANGVLKSEQGVTAAVSAAGAASARASSAESEALAASNAVTTQTAKTARLIQVFVERFNGEIGTLAQRIGSSTGVSSASPQPAPVQTQESPSTLHFAGYHDKKENRFTTGRCLREYERLTRNGFIKVADFQSDAEAAVRLQHKNGASPALTPSPPNPRDELASASLEGGIAAQISVLMDKINALESELDSVKKVTVTKGISVDKYSFDSLEDLMALIRAENISTTAFGVAVDPVSFFCHHKSGKLDEARKSNEMKAMKLAGITNITALRWVHSFRGTHPPFFLNACGSPIQHGMRFPMLDSEAAWQGTGLSKGGCVDLETAIEETTTSVETYIEQNLPDGKVKDLCVKLLSLSSKWLSNMLTYLNREIKRVLKYGIPEQRTYTLVSDQLHTMFEEMWCHRRLMQEFDKETYDDVEYFARGIWTTMQALSVCHEFSSVNFASHNLISSVFVRFLAEETGSNFSSGLTNTLQEMKSQVNAVDSGYKKTAVAINRRLDSHTDHLKRLCAKVPDVTFKPMAKEG